MKRIIFESPILCGAGKGRKSFYVAEPGDPLVFDDEGRLILNAKTEIAYLISLAERDISLVIGECSIRKNFIDEETKAIEELKKAVGIE